MHGVSVGLRYLLKKNGKPDHNYSRLQLYYDGRKLEGTIDSDSGLEIRDAIKCVAKLGVAHEELWPYDVSKFKLPPPPSVYTDANNYQALEYKRVEISARAVKTAIAQGYPVIIGLTLFSSFESDAVEKTGIVPMPDIHKEENVGGHCMAAVGYGQKPGYITVQNSWDVDWGDKGYCYLPEEYIGSKNFGGDYWIITKAEQ
jgi:C1A family cysteine protease